MSNCIIYNDPQTGMAVVSYPAYNDLSRPTGDTDDALVLRLIERSMPPGVSYTVVDSSVIPTDRYFRNAWEWED